jgi:hypothetical protein
MMTVADIRDALDDAVARLPLAELPDLLAILAGTSARATLRLTTPPPITSRPDEIVDVATLSAELGLAPSWLRSQARAGKLPHLRCGKYIKFRRSELLAALGRSGADHGMGEPVPAEKPSNGAGSFPPDSKIAGEARAD